MPILAIDIETYSSVDLIKSGVYKYVQEPDFSILLFAYMFNDERVEIVDLAQGEELPEGVINALIDPRYTKVAYNANFERTCIGHFFFREKLDPTQWECTMAKAAMLGLPLGLDMTAKALKLKQEKSTTGKALIRYFSIPCKPTKANGGRTRNLPEHDLEKWQQFKDYCEQDVIVEQAIREKIKFFDIPETEKKLWVLDQHINDTGVLLDPEFIKQAIDIDNTHRDTMLNEAVRLTGLDNPNSAAQLKQWISDQTGNEVNSLTKEAVPELLKDTNCSTVKRVLRIRQELAKTSVKKYEAMVNVIGLDNRCRGLLQYYGANRTGRWAGRLVQVQNLPQNHLPDLDLARDLVKKGDADMLQLLYGNVPNVLSQLVRTAFVAPKGHRFIIADFAAIEARVIAWLANEKWRLDVFNTHGKIYEASASQMFKVPIGEITKGSVLRQKGKVAELALGYQGGPNALITMGALKNGITEDELPKLVAAWRSANKAIVRLWNKVEEAAIIAVAEGTPNSIQYGIRFFTDKNILFIKLPSGRCLAYMRPQMRSNRFGGEALSYEGVNQTSKQWGIQDTYGGKLVENIVQAIARDCLADAMLRLDAAGYKVVMHVHDEVVLEVPEDQGGLAEVNNIMGTGISWAKGLPLKADSYETAYYKKD